jgi:hypothetical protein
MRFKRSLLYPALAAAAALTLVLVPTAGAANGDPLIIGQLNVGSLPTILLTSGVTGYSVIDTSADGNTRAIEAITAAANSGAVGVFGSTSNTDLSEGSVQGLNNSTATSAIGVRGHDAGSGYGGYFTAPGALGYGVEGIGGDRGVDATGGNYGVFGNNNAPGANEAGVRGTINSAALNAAGVRGDNFNAACCGMGVAGFHSGQGIGVYGESLNGFAVSGFSPNNWSGYFQGSVNVVGTLFKTSGAFRIDNPLDPAHSYLQHSFVESPDMKNIYDGNVTTNGKGFATVKLPAYFQALNKDFRYQLTSLSGLQQVAVAKEVKNNRFVIQSEKPNSKVSWQVTGIRKDAWANAHRIQTVVPKTGSADNKYLHPELYGKPLTKSVVVLPGMDGKSRAKVVGGKGK